MKKYHNDYDKIQRNINPIYRLIKNNRNRIYEALKSNNKATDTINLLNCTRDFYYHWIKFNLPYEMSDDEFRNNYEIDHVVALSSFDFSNKENQFIAFGWENTRPLLKSKNRSKGAKRDLYSEVLQKLKIRMFLKLYYPEYY